MTLTEADMTDTGSPGEEFSTEVEVAPVALPVPQRSTRKGGRVQKRRGTTTTPRGEGESGTNVTIDDEHRKMLDQYGSWYYPGGATLTYLIHEMMDLAYARAKKDSQRVEAREARVERLSR